MPDEILNDISHRRFNPLRGSWLLVSPHRTKRPWQGQQEPPSLTTLPAYDPACYLCPGNKRAAGDSNPKYESTFVFVNDYSAVKEVQATYEADESKDLASTLLRAEPVTGKCYVLTFSPEHNLTLADMNPASILPVVKMWTSIYALHLDPTSPLSELPFEADGGPPAVGNPSEQLGLSKPTDQYRYMQIFENKGSAMGCSNPHPHGQIWTLTGLPEEPALEIENLKLYREKNNGRNMLEDYVKLELEKKERIVWQNSTFVVLCPWWAVWPFEIMVIPKRHVRAIVELTAEEQLGFAEAIAEVTRRYDNLFETSFPYSSGIHQSPLSGPDSDCDASHMHMHFYPPLLRSATVRKFLVGYELMAEPQRDITAEQAAARLRDCGGPLYREKLLEQQK